MITARWKIRRHSNIKYSNISTTFRSQNWVLDWKFGFEDHCRLLARYIPRYLEVFLPVVERQVDLIPELIGIMFQYM